MIAALIGASALVALSIAPPMPRGQAALRQPANGPTGATARSFDFHDNDDGRTISVILARAEIAAAAEQTGGDRDHAPPTASGNDGDAQLRLTLRFTGPDIEPPPGYMHRPGSNQRCSRAVAHGLKHGWLTTASRRGDGRTVDRPATWDASHVESIATLELDARGRMIDVPGQSWPTRVEMTQSVGLSSLPMNATTPLQTTILWRGEPRLVVDWAVTRSAGNAATAEVLDITQPREVLETQEPVEW